MDDEAAGPAGPDARDPEDATPTAPLTPSGSDPWVEARRLFTVEDLSYREIAAQTGLAYSTVRHRAQREGWERVEGSVQAADPSITPEKVSRRELNLKGRRLNLASRLLDEAETLLDEMHAPSVRHEVKVVPQGRDMGSEVEIVEVTEPSAPASDKRNLAVSAAILIDKSQLLSGEATSRNEDLTPEERRDRLRQIRDELEERRERARLASGD